MHFIHCLRILCFCYLSSGWLCIARAQQTFFPGAVPLAVRSPTFNCWLAKKAGLNPIATWPTFWNDIHILGWTGYIKVDGVTWGWLGGDNVNNLANASIWRATQVTPTRTIFTVDVGSSMQLNVTFLSPIEPGDWGKQSFPFSYVYIDGKATDGKPHSIQLYSDIMISGGALPILWRWVTNSPRTGIQWSSAETGNTSYHQVKSTTPTSNFNDVAEDSVAYHAISREQPNLVSVIGTARALRRQFAAPGECLNLTSDLSTQTGNMQADDGNFTVFAHALNLGTTGTISTISWAVGLVRDPITTFSGVNRSSYYWAQYAGIADAIDAFMADFPAARTRALALDQKILQDALDVSQEYADLVSLATRQAMAGVEITLSKQQDGSWNSSDVQAFMKDVGNSQRVNPTETLYAALPAFMYLNGSITGALLEPLLRYQISSARTNPYAASDLGLVYPAGSNTNDPQVYGVENCANMLILVLAHARSSGDRSLMNRYYTLLKQWAEYLNTNALIPQTTQNSADARNTILGQGQANVTNLALKGLIAIQAMSQISQLTGQSADAQKYATSARNLMQSWVDLTSVSGRLRWTYGESSFGLMYNLLADKLLQLNIVPASIYQQESSTLADNTGQGRPYTIQWLLDAPDSDFSSSVWVPIEQRHPLHWTLFSAAAAPDVSTRNALISAVHKSASANSSNATFPTVYNAQSGVGPARGVPQNGPAQGAMFSLLALNTSFTLAAPPAIGPESKSLRKNTRAIVGGTIGALAVLILIGAVLFLRRNRRRGEARDKLRVAQPYDSGSNTGTTSDSPAVALAVFNRSKAEKGTPNLRRRQTDPLSHEASQSASSQHHSSESRGTDDLRSEVQRLREEMEQLRTTHVPEEAPPVYQ
ncbi:hypothetical protein DFH06DRAFT_1396782 [Mycena polygramma]|nr:hypothetical protein DFH06DRAFT_1396782 [Mycena polygramma]